MKGSAFGRSSLVAALLAAGPLVARAADTTIHAALDGADAARADIFVDGRHRGQTDDLGFLRVDSAILQDGKTTITARLRVYEAPAFLAGHEDPGTSNGWVMRVYVTNVAVADTGEVRPFVVADRTATQELALKRDNTLIGLQILVSTDWDMSKDEIVELMQTIQRASRFLWNATDGQFFFERARIADQTGAWGWSEYKIYADNVVHPRATAGGYLGQNFIGVTAGAFISLPGQGTVGPGRVSSGSGWDFRTFVHEFGHLGFDLGDEYGYVEHETCTVNRTTATAAAEFRVGGEKAACLMDSDSGASKFCSDHGDNAHNYISFQPDDCWAEIRGHYSDPQGQRWILKTPVTRGQIVGSLRDTSGDPDRAFPAEWNTTFGVTNKGWRTELCQPFAQSVTFADATPAHSSPVFLQYTSTDPSGHTWISQGKTLKDGSITILGSHQEDTVKTERVFNQLSVCPAGVAPQGPIGTIVEDLDGDRVLDAFDTCPELFNPYEIDTTSPTSIGQGSCSSCTSDSQCRALWVCSATATGAKQCVAPTCTNDADCGSGLRCQAAGGMSRCVDGLGVRCRSHSDCSTGYCDAGDGSSRTGLCLPNQDGQPGDLCSQDVQCTSRNCGGLAPDGAGGWQPGACSPNTTKPLGDFCFSNPQCSSGNCDAGLGTSHTDRCMPRGNTGQPGEICSNDNQCLFANCGGLAPRAGGGWQPGRCANTTRKALGEYCFGSAQCTTGFCDAGRTNRCMPDRNGQFGGVCSHDEQCTSLNCSGLDGSGGALSGTCGNKKTLGVACLAHSQCASNYCDAGWGTSKTYRCMPNSNGQIGDICSHDNQCTSLTCGSLRQDTSGAWVPGACSSKTALGSSCSQHHQCGSGYCDSGINTSRTDLCMPNTNGRSGDPCSHPNQCTSRSCSGLRAEGGRWIPGQCQ